ncbi:MAG TPA: hypothetical protein VK577_00475, partial [Bradyrhizobium sp.]|nr:hypothetical protein [Bradyrhizobium sp.]
MAKKSDFVEVKSQLANLTREHSRKLLQALEKKQKEPSKTQRSHCDTNGRYGPKKIASPPYDESRNSA